MKREELIKMVDEIAPNRVVVDEDAFFNVDFKRKQGDLRWYETMDERTHSRYWWTQRDKKGVCFEIKQRFAMFKLYRCDTFVGNFFSLQSAMNAVSEML